MVTATKSKTITPNKCVRPGCNGVFLDDGEGLAVCNLCGRPPITGDPLPEPKKEIHHVEPADKTDVKIDRIFDKPVPPKPKGTKSIRQWIDDNKALILSDIERLGTEGTLERWHIKRTAIRNAKIRWGLILPSKSTKKTAKAIGDKMSKIAPETTNPELHHLKGVAMGTVEVKIIWSLPPFPTWSNEWAIEVQLRWLDGYLVLKGIK